MKKGDVGVGNLSMSKACFFARLGIPVVWDLDLTLLDQAYFAQQRLLHPDRYVGQGEGMRSQAQGASAALNAAYETLKNPMGRAQHLLERQGLAVNDVQDPEFLQRMMIFNERALEGDATLLAELDRDMAHLFDQFGQALGSNRWEDCQTLFSRLTFLHKLRTRLREQQE